MHWILWPFLCILSPGPLLHAAVGPHFFLSCFYYWCTCRSPPCCPSCTSPVSRWALAFLSLLHCLSSVSISLAGELTLLPPLVSFLFMSGFIQERLVHPCRSPVAFDFCAHQDWPFLSLEEANLENQPALLNNSSLWGSLPWDSSEKTKVWYPKV